MSEQQSIDAPRSSEPDETSGRWYDTFFHRRVLRAGWGLVFFLGLLCLLIAGQTVVLRNFPSPNDTPHLVLVPHDAIGNIVLLLAVAITTAVLTLLEQRHYGDYGFGGTARVRLLLGGLLSGALILTALVFTLHGLGFEVFRGETLFGKAVQWRQAAIWAGFYLLVALTEELLLRGYLLYSLTRGIASVLRHYFAARLGIAPAFWIAGVTLSLVYGWLHGLNSGETSIGVLSTAALGLLFVFSLWRTGSLWWALGFHLAWDWMQSFVFGTADSGLRIRDHLFYTEPFGNPLLSGGTAGPEGSVYVFGALAAMLGLLFLLNRHGVYPELWVEAELDSPPEFTDTLPDPDR